DATQRGGPRTAEPARTRRGGRTRDGPADGAPANHDVEPARAARRARRSRPRCYGGPGRGRPPMNGARPGGATRTLDGDPADRPGVMFEHLDIYSPRERVAVGLADLGLRAVAAAWPRRRAAVAQPRRILLLRLERIGDLLMSLGAIRAVRRAAPDARIDLVVGSWNEPIARLLPEVTDVETLDAPWLARNGRGSMRELIARASSWGARDYDLAINFEGDIRSNLLPFIAGSARRVGFVHAGGGPLLTDVVEHDPRRHVADGGLRLVERAFDMPA